MDEDDFCPICVVEGRDECGEHCETDTDDDLQRELNSWHDDWERDEFGCK